MNKKMIIGISAGVLAAIIIVVVLIFSLGGTKITDNKIYSAGDVVKVPIAASKNPGIFAVQTVIKFDLDAFEYLDVESDVFTTAEATTTGDKVTVILLANSKNIKKKGTIATLSFMVKDNAKADKYIFSVLSDESDYVNFDEERVNPQIITVDSIKVK